MSSDVTQPDSGPYLCALDIRTANSGPIRVPLGTACIFVGPNNSGKSLALSEIRQFSSGGKIVLGVHHRLLSLRDYERLAVESDADRFLFRKTPDEEGSAVTSADEIVERAAILERVELQPKDSARSQMSLVVMAHNTISLSDGDRTYIRKPVPFSSPLGQSQSILDTLLKDSKARSEVSQLVEEAFQRQLLLDTVTVPGNVSPRLAEPGDPRNSTPLTQEVETESYCRRQPTLDSFSPGVQGFLSMVSRAAVTRKAIFLVDEPESSLHPPLAGRLARFLVRKVATRGGNLIAATHSPEFLLGAITQAPDATVVRLSYSGGVGDARVLLPVDLNHIIRDPLLRSADALGAVFHAAAIVCEADSDRALYQECNVRLEEAGDDGIPDAVFLNAQGGDTIHRLVAPLRDLGVPAVAIPDLDVLISPNPTFNQLLQACKVEPKVAERLRSQRSKICADRDSLKTLIKAGISALPAPYREAVIEIVETSSDYGLFFVPVGELECWLSELRVSPGEKGSWLRRIFERIGSDSNSAEYVRPSHNDIWEFLRRIAKWTVDPNRHGMGGSPSSDN